MPDYLKVMGVDYWTLRHNATPALPACYAYELFREDQCVGLLFAAAEKEEAATAELLHKMMAAIECEPRGKWYSMQPDYSELSGLRFVITLGEGFEVDDAIAHLHSHAPQRLMAKPSLKADTWKTLQGVFSILSD